MCALLNKITEKLCERIAMKLFRLCFQVVHLLRSNCINVGFIRKRINIKSYNFCLLVQREQNGRNRLLDAATRSRQNVKQKCESIFVQMNPESSSKRSDRVCAVASTR